MFDMCINEAPEKFHESIWFKFEKQFREKDIQALKNALSSDHYKILKDKKIFVKVIPETKLNEVLRCFDRVFQLECHEDNFDDEIKNEHYANIEKIHIKTHS